MVITSNEQVCTKKEDVGNQGDQATQFLLIHTYFILEKLIELYIIKIVRLHGILVLIISYQDPMFISQFFKKLHEALGTKLNFSMTFYP